MSMRDALAALCDLAGLSLKDPFEYVTAWQNSWYCADETFQLDPSSSSSSERDLSLMFSAVWRAAEKFTGDPSLGEDSEDEDLLTRYLDHVELLDSSISLHLLTRVLDLLVGVWESLVLGVSTIGLSWLSATGITPHPTPPPRVWRPSRVCRARHTCRLINCCWPSWRLNDCDRLLLRWVQYGSSQFHISSGNIRWPCVVLILVLMFSMMMLLGQGPVVNRSTRWRGQGSVVDRSPRVMMMMSGSRRPEIRSLPRITCWSRMVCRINMLGLRAGPSRRGRMSDPLPTLIAPGWVTSPGRLMTSLRSTTVISVTTLCDHLEGQWSVALDVLDEVSGLVFLAESCCCKVDLSSLFLTGEVCSP